MANVNTATEQFGNFSKSAIDAAMKFATASFTNAERVIALNLEATKVSLGETAKNAKSFAAIKDAQELNSLSTKTAETGVEFLMGYSKNFYEISTAAQAQYTALVEERVNVFQQSVAETLDKVSKSAPAGSDVAVTALKSGMAASTAAMDNFSKAAKQMTAFADTAYKTASDTAAKAAPKRK